MANLLINQGTNSAINFDLSGTVNTQVIAMGYGTVSTVGTLPNLPGGSIVMTNGTLAALPNLPQGSINVTAGTIGTVSGVGVVTSVTNLVGGTLGILTNGTLSSAGTVTGVGSVSSLGSLGMLTAGTVSMINAGTITSVGTVPGIGILTAGTISMINAGTLGTVTNLGSVTNLGQVYNAGTIQNILGGTIQQSVLPTLGVSTYGTHGTTGASIFGTLAGGTGSGAGTEIFITSLSLTIPSTGGSQDASIGWGTNGGTFQAGTGLLVRGNFPPGGGIQKTFSYPYPNSGTNAQLCLFQAGAGTVDVSITYFLAVSSL